MDTNDLARMLLRRAAWVMISVFGNANRLHHFWLMPPALSTAACSRILISFSNSLSAVSSMQRTRYEDGELLSSFPLLMCTSFATFYRELKTPSVKHALYMLSSIWGNTRANIFRTSVEIPSGPGAILFWRDCAAILYSSLLNKGNSPTSHSVMKKKWTKIDLRTERRWKFFFSCR